MYGNNNPTVKLASQFTMVAIVTATGRASCINSSATISQGIPPTVMNIVKFFTQFSVQTLAWSHGKQCSYSQCTDHQEHTRDSCNAGILSVAIETILWG